MSKNTKPICPSCKSQNVVVDAVADWDVNKEMWVICDFYSHKPTCNDCGKEHTLLEWVDVDAQPEPLKEYEVVWGIQVGAYATDTVKANTVEEAIAEARSLGTGDIVFTPEWDTGYDERILSVRGPDGEHFLDD